MRAGCICAALLAFACAFRQGIAQYIPCFVGHNCLSGFVANEATLLDCCSQSNTFSYRPSQDSEHCPPCYAYGWVTNITSDLTSAEMQPDITMATEGDTITLTVFYTKNFPTSSLRVTFFLDIGGNATEDEDYTISSDAIFNDRIQFTEAPVQVNVTLLNDGVVGEPEEDIVLTLRQDLFLSPLENFRVLIHPTIRIVFSDNDGPAEVGFIMDGIIVAEGEGSVFIRVNISHEITSPLMVDVQIEGTVTEGEDYFRTGQSQITFEPGDRSKNILVSITDDNIIEPSESLFIVLSNPQPAGQVVLGIHNFTITIIDTDLPVVGFEEESYTKSEMFCGVTVCASVANGNVLRDLSINIDVVSSTATIGENFDFVSEPVIFIGAGMRRGCLQISIIPLSVIELMESFILALNTSAVDALTGPFAETTVFILCDGAAGSNNYTALIIATTVGVPSVAVIIVAIIVIIMCRRKKKGEKKDYAMNEDPIYYDDPDGQLSGGVKKTEIALQELPQLKENIAYVTFAP